MPKETTEKFRRNEDGTFALPEAKVRPAELVQQELYELRTLSGCPNQTVHIPCHSTGNVACFSAYRGLPMMTPEGRFQGPVQAGGLQRLTEAEVEDVMAGVGRLVVLDRPNGTGGIYDRDSPHLRGARETVPLAKYLSMRIAPANALQEPPVASMAG